MSAAPATPLPEVVLSVVVPVYGCADCLGALHERLTRSVAQVTDRYEFVFVDDRSLDGGWDVLQELAGFRTVALPLSADGDRVHLDVKLVAV